MPKVPVLQEFARAPASDFYAFQWRWEGQTNLTIQTTGVKSPDGARFAGRRPQYWPSFNGQPISPEILANSIRSSNTKLDNIELILRYGGANTKTATSYAGQLAEALGNAYGVISYSSTCANSMDKIQEALKELPDAISGDVTGLDQVAKLPGLAMPGFSRKGSAAISRFRGQSRLSYGRRGMQPYHVRAGKGSPHLDVAGSMPRVAGDAAGGRVSRAPAGDAAIDAEEFIDVVAL